MPASKPEAPPNPPSDGDQTAPATPGDRSATTEASGFDNFAKQSLIQPISPLLLANAYPRHGRGATSSQASASFQCKRPAATARNKSWQDRAQAPAAHQDPAKRTHWCDQGSPRNAHHQDLGVPWSSVEFPWHGSCPPVDGGKMRSSSSPLSPFRLHPLPNQRHQHRTRGKRPCPRLLSERPEIATRRDDHRRAIDHRCG
jgi:hypothetical protein